MAVPSYQTEFAAKALADALLGIDHLLVALERQSGVAVPMPPPDVRPAELCGLFSRRLAAVASSLAGTAFPAQVGATARG